MQQDSSPATSAPGNATPAARHAPTGPVIVLGGGLVGLPAGLVFAMAGHAVRLVEVDEGRRAAVPRRVAELLDSLTEHGLLTREGAMAAASRVLAFEDVAAAVACDERPPTLLLEAVFEDLELKRRALAEAERHLDRSTIMCSVTSGLSITAIAASLDHPQRFCGAHVWNPPHLIPLVEVVYGERTADDTVTAVCRLFELAGKRPVVVRRDVPGFIGNRLLHALQKEAMAIVAAGIASAEDVDLVVTQSFGRRLSSVGPLAACDMAGLDLVLEVDKYLLRDLDRSPDPSPLLVQLVRDGKVGVRSLQGFYTWTEESVRQTIAARDASLIRALRADRHGPLQT
jgi:3-hydroxybutyryl-CoA dehydrogenase